MLASTAAWSTALGLLGSAALVRATHYPGASLLDLSHETACPKRGSLRREWWVELAREEGRDEMRVRVPGAGCSAGSLCSEWLVCSRCWAAQHGRTGLGGGAGASLASSPLRVDLVR